MLCFFLVRQQVRPTDASPVLRQKVQAACAIAYAELGFCRPRDDYGGVSFSKDENEVDPPPSAPRTTTAYLYVHEQRIVGLCVVERISAAHRLTAHGDDGTTTRACQTEGAVLGVHLLWIHPNHRRQGIAKSLIDQACATMVYGYRVPPTLVALSSPTTAGTRFAQWYCDRLDILVYDCV
jgi:ribosomal protein S18 acetylase RimI-like enzyme